MIQYSVDPEASAAYLRLDEDEIARTIEISDQINLDLASTDAVIGIEFLAIGEGGHVQMTAQEFHALQRLGVPLEAMSFIESSIATTF